MKKLLTVGLALAMSCSLFVGCSGGATEGENTNPKITGFSDTYTVKAGEEFNALSGVSASDAEDGDLTNKIVVSSLPEVPFKNGIAVFEQMGDYDIIYTVTDSGGLKAEEFATLKVTKADAVETLYHTFDFSESTAPVDKDGWDVAVAEAGAATMKTEKGLLIADITNGGTEKGDVILQKTNLEVEKDASYEIRLYIGATKEVEVYTAVQNEVGNVGNTFKAVPLTDSIQIVTMSFKAAEAAQDYKIVVHAGGGADAYQVYMEKVEIYKSTGVESTTEIFTQNFGGAEASSSVEKYPFDQGTKFSVNEGKLNLSIESYPEANIWERGIHIKTNVNIVKDKKYRFTADINVENAQQYVFLMENDKGEGPGVGRWDGAWIAGENKVSFDFVATGDLENAYIAFQLGFKPADATSNNIVMDNIIISEITSIPDVQKSMTRFMPYNENTGYDVFNGTDDSSGKFDGTGRIYTDGDSMNYVISNVGSVDYYNKIIFRLSLEEMATYKFVFKAKANVNVKGAFLVNVTNGAYDPIVVNWPEITTETQEISFTATKSVMLDNSYDIIFQCGGAENAQKGQIEIEFSDFRIYKIV